MTQRTLFLLAVSALAARAHAQAPANALRFPAGPIAAAPTSVPVPAPAASLMSLVERLRLERRSQMEQGRVLPLGSFERSASIAAALAGPRYLPTPIAAVVPAGIALASEREAAGAPALPRSWNWNGERTLGLSEAAAASGSRSSQTWRMSLDVPVTHLWGRATLSAGFEKSQPGTASDAEGASAPLQQNANISLRQDIKKGTLSGSAQLAVSGADSQQQASGVSGGASGARDLSAKAEGSAQLKLQVTPALAITGSHASRLEHDTAMKPAQAQNSDSEAASGALAGGASAVDVERQAARRTNSELGLEWKLSRSLSLSGAASATRAGQATGASDAARWIPRSLSDESRANLALQKRTGGGSWGLNWSRAWTQKEVAPDGAPETTQPMQQAWDARSDALSLQAEHKVFGWLQMRGSWKLAGETNYLAARLSEQATREAEARISGGLGSLALRYSDWSSQSSAADSLGDSARREYGVRYEAGREAGLGLALEYSVRQERASDPASNWKLGVTYR